MKREDREDRPQEGLSATELLRADHAKIKGLFDEFESIEEDESGKKDLVEIVLRELIIHDKLEEEFFYPAAREALEDTYILDEAAEEHHVIKLLIKELAPLQPRDDKYDAKLRVLADYVRRHIDEEESSILPKLEESESDLMELGKHMQERKEELIEAGIEPARWALEDAALRRKREVSFVFGGRRSKSRAAGKGRRVSGGRRAGKGKASTPGR